MLGPNAAQAPSGFELAPDPAKASPLQIGRTLDMHTPDGAAVFTMRTKVETRAQAYLRSASPGPFPAGLVAFSPVYEVAAEPPPDSADTAIVVRVSPNAVAPDRFGDLKLYVFDSVEGWKAFDKQRSSAEAHSVSTMDFSFSAMDRGRRVYAVLGPADAARPR
jgi:hypothetical protein